MTTSKKSTVQKPLPFNKKNTETLANLIYSDKGGIITAMKLCHGELSNGKDGGRTLHCAVGEAYFTFVSKDMRKVLKCDDSDSNYESTYNDAEGSTGAAIDALVEVAQLKTPTPGNKRKLGSALEDAVNQNDSAQPDIKNKDSAVFIERSEKVAEIFRTRVAPLLK